MSSCFTYLQDVGEDYSVTFPKLYAPGLTDMYFNKTRFSLSLLEGFITSCVIFFVTYGCLIDEVRYDGLDLATKNSFAFMTATILILCVTLRVCGVLCLWNSFL